MKETHKKKEGFFKNLWREIVDSAIADVIWNMVIFFPRMIVRIWRIFD